jgi:hypothetical protein
LAAGDSEAAAKPAAAYEIRLAGVVLPIARDQLSAHNLTTIVALWDFIQPVLFPL